MADTRGILLGMKEKLVQGWIQGELKRDDEGVCLYGALKEAAGLMPRYVKCDTLVEGRGSAKYGQISSPITVKAYVVRDNPAAYEATLLLREAAGVDPDGLALWNDAPERTQGDIVDLIDKALQALDKKESDGLRGSAQADQRSEAGVR